MKRYLSASLKIRERRHPAGHANVWFILAILWWIPLALGHAALPATLASQALWYDSPAQNWESEALPIGNGRLGAMIFGASEKETVQLNEDSLWLGDEKDSGMYQNLGEFEVALPRAKPVELYRRELDISRAVHTVTYTSDGVTYRRETFASFPDQVMVFCFTADKPSEDRVCAIPLETPPRARFLRMIYTGLPDGVWPSHCEVEVSGKSGKPYSAYDTQIEGDKK